MVTIRHNPAVMFAVIAGFIIVIVCGLWLYGILDAAGRKVETDAAKIAADARRIFAQADSARVAREAKRDSVRMALKNEVK